MKVITILVLILLSTQSFSQDNNTLHREKWINYHRERRIVENGRRIFDEQKYITSHGDTLTRSFVKSANTQEVQLETSYLHGEKNGLEISYHPNGIIKEINYYLNGRLWETISRADSTGKLLDPGTLHNGNGSKFFYDNLLFEPNCYITYRNGLPEGPFYLRQGTSILIGDLTYNQLAVNYIPAKKVVYMDKKGDTSIGTFELNQFYTVFQKRVNALEEYKIISALEDSLAENPREFIELSYGFSDPAIIPRGNWKEINVKDNRVIKSIDYDNSGNAIKIVAFKNDGSKLWERNYQSCSKRKIIKRDTNGSYLGEDCKIGF